MWRDVRKRGIQARSRINRSINFLFTGGDQRLKEGEEETSLW